MSIVHTIYNPVPICQTSYDRHAPHISPAICSREYPRPVARGRSQESGHDTYCLGGSDFAGEDLSDTKVSNFYDSSFFVEHNVLRFEITM